MQKWRWWALYPVLTENKSNGLISYWIWAYTKGHMQFKPKKLTVLQLLQQLPAPTRYQAIINLDSEKRNEWCTSQPAALKRAFLWNRVPEGYQYWETVYNSIQ